MIDETELRSSIQSDLANCDFERGDTFCIRSMVDHYHEDSGRLQGTVVAIIIDELEHRLQNAA